MSKTIRWDDLSTTRPTSATVDWTKFTSMTKGKILAFYSLRRIFQDCGGKSDANLRRKLYSMKRKGLVEIRYNVVGGRVVAYYKFK